MRTLDNQVRAQKIYMSHMQQKLGNEKTGKRKNSKKVGVTTTIDRGLKPNNHMEVSESVRSSRV